MNVTFSPPNTIGKMVDSAKDHVDLKNQKDVYIIPFSCGKVYIGETERSINICLKEHVLEPINHPLQDIHTTLPTTYA